MTPSEESRAEFEAWAISADFGLYRSTAGYSSTRTAAAWASWQASRRAAMEKAAKIAEAGIDSLEQDRAEKAVRAAAKSGDEDDEVRRLRHHSGVSLHNGALQRAAAAIRASAQKEA